MPASESKLEIDRLGDELRSAETPSEDLVARLASICRLRETILEEVRRRLADQLGLPTGKRLKTLATVVAKLRRMPKLRLSEMQDIAGVRVVLDMTRLEQTAWAARIAQVFSDAQVRLVDRRLQPSHGYRAIHIVITVNGVPVEIQVRTLLQHVWAQTVERFAALWGRQIQYGQPPDEPAHLEKSADSFGETQATRVEWIQALQVLSDYIASLEDLRSLAAGRHLLQTVQRSGSAEAERVGEEATDGQLRPGSEAWLRNYETLAKACLIRLCGVSTC